MIVSLLAAVVSRTVHKFHKLTNKTEFCTFADLQRRVFFEAYCRQVTPHIGQIQVIIIVMLLTGLQLL